MGPILFLNPTVVLPPIGPNADPRPWFEPVGRGIPPLPNGNMDWLNRLTRAIGMAVVLTDLRAMGDARWRLWKQGLKAAFHPCYATDEALAGGSGGMAGWLTANGNPAHVTVDRAPDAPDPTWITVVIGAEVRAADVDAALAALLGQ